ncbi:transcriptional regulator [Natribaculum luteum]|uniref:Transcriptional regulator n=1 Tax=Natribaculum luteum TaxID=1586232 RepID=A0ABD5NXU7_9EURY|nr:transcriptional regulator [Natribaculum luteum]
MSRDETGTAKERSGLPPKTITDRLEDVDVGDRLVVNNRETAYEVVDTDTYSVTVADPDGNHITLSQNLQTGGWVVHEEIWWVSSDSLE